MLPAENGARDEAGGINVPSARGSGHCSRFRALKDAETTAPGRNLCSVAAKRVCDAPIGRKKGDWACW